MIIFLLHFFRFSHLLCTAFYKYIKTQIQRHNKKNSVSPCFCVDIFFWLFTRHALPLVSPKVGCGKAK